MLRIDKSRWVNSTVDEGWKAIPHTKETGKLQSRAEKNNNKTASCRFSSWAGQLRSLQIDLFNHLKLSDVRIVSSVVQSVRSNISTDSAPAYSMETCVEIIGGHGINLEKISELQ